ncbi:MULTISPECIES: 4a-hydroxytetrahydrobiopterin dehydratase [Paenibacillus]|uniref:4a-hydroxytetrahydrobiopterin dehydratase n=1 Tax=Paenibacillus TaxID=44249 RepID=UPI0027D9BE46|nr:4a-hydroxytetrahydrobiopterin dehydratase [Paenibacillus validus]
MMKPKLADEAFVKARLGELPGWGLEETKWIVKRYRFRAFLDGIAFVQEVARIAEEANHHPLIAIDYKVVTLKLTTWSAGGLTELDLESAGRFDAAYAAVRVEAQEGE